MARRSSIHRDLRSPKYKARVVASKKKRPPRMKPDWRQEVDRDSENGKRGRR
jgi:hypothetical protein